jgi:hypothetical protein
MIIINLVAIKCKIEFYFFKRILIQKKKKKLGTNLPSTFIQSTQQETPISTSNASNCLYPNVPNCENCGFNSIKVDESLFHVSCVFVENKWIYSYKNKSSDCFLVAGDCAIESQNFFFVDGYMNQTSNSIISFDLSLSSTSSKIVVKGCIDLEGKIEVNLDDRPSNNGNQSFYLISFNCSSAPLFSDTKVILNTKYKDNQCDSIKSFSSINQNSLSISLSSTLNKNCGGKNFNSF